VIVIFNRDGTIEMERLTPRIEACEVCGAPVCLDKDETGLLTWQEITCECFAELPFFPRECQARVPHTPERCLAVRAQHGPQGLII
jgi:hypothetical protein